MAGSSTRKLRIASALRPSTNGSRACRATKLVTGGLFIYFPRLFTRGEQRAEAVAALRPGFLWGLASAVVFAVSLIGYHGLDLMLGRTVTAGG